MEGPSQRVEASPRLEALWARVFEQPDELSLRQVLADALQEVGDGRGEFIALQLLPEAQRTAAQRRRELMVLAEQGSWLGLHGVAGLKRTLAFWRGLPSEIELRLLDVDVDRPELALVRRVVIRGREGEGGVLGSSTWRLLERVEGVPACAVRHLVRATAPRLRAVTLAQPPTEQDLQRLATLPGLQEFGWAVTQPLEEGLLNLFLLRPLEKVALLLADGNAHRSLPVPALRLLLQLTPVVEVRALVEAGEVRVAVRAQAISLQCRSRTHWCWGLFRHWLGWLALTVPTDWAEATVELDGRVLEEAEWRALAREP